MARKANYELDPKRDSKLEHELQVARYLAVAFIAQSHGIGMDYARKKYAQMPVGPFWLEVARMVSTGAPMSNEATVFVVPPDRKIQ